MRCVISLKKEKKNLPAKGEEEEVKKRSLKRGRGGISVSRLMKWGISRRILINLVTNVAKGRRENISIYDACIPWQEGS